ncbi:MAG: dihydroneopterin aldolase [Candidatus Hydrogenedentales bacterium]
MADETDRIHIRDLLVRCIIGVNDDERERKQDVLINITLHANLRRAAATDDIHETVDYKAIKTRVMDLTEASQFYLIERLADRIADTCLEHDAVQQVDVTVDKPGALRFARSVAVSISRRRVGA